MPDTKYVIECQICEHSLTILGTAPSDDKHKQETIQDHMAYLMQIHLQTDPEARTEDKDLKRLKRFVTQVKPLVVATPPEAI